VAGVVCVDFFEVRAVGVEQCEQGGGDEDSPERPEDSEDDGGKDRRPDGDLGRSPHDVGLEQEAIEQGDDDVKDEHAERVLPVHPFNGGGENRSEQSEDRAEMRHDLKDGSEQRPEWSERDVEDVESDEPENADGERVEELGDGPVLERVAGNA